ncbi:uncharacterized protein [Battus philenor]|uniref:uncharacterized protein n=1 Tax=Battus philenor TaxID=42288 RepID=UPI0035CFA19E
MISVVTNIVNLLATIIQWLFISTSLLGKIIVTVITTIYSSVLKSAKNVSLFFQIVYEDNVTIFTEEIPNLTVSSVEFLDALWLEVQNYFYMTWHNVVHNLKLIIGTIRWSVEEIWSISSDIVIMGLKTLIFFGEALWLVLTFIPIQLPQLLQEAWNTINSSLYYSAFAAYTNLLKFTNFLNDVPLESFVGLLLAMIIGRLCIHFSNTLRSHSLALYWVLIRKVLYFYYVIYNYFNDYETRLITHMVGGQQLIPQGDADVIIAEESSSASDALCVICQERPKCVLTLPCRHVCLCSECCMRLYGYQRTCPICRTFIYHSVSVYL